MMGNGSQKQCIIEIVKLTRLNFAVKGIYRTDLRAVKNSLTALRGIFQQRPIRNARIAPELSRRYAVLRPIIKTSQRSSIVKSSQSSSYKIIPPHS